MTRKSYFEQLKDPRWQRKRLEILQRAGFACEHCGDSTQTLHVHHTFYERGKAPWEYDDSDLMALCENCHEGMHQIRAEIDQLIGALMTSNAFDLHRLIGYAKAMVTAREVEEEPRAGFLELDGRDEVDGAADYFRVRPAQLIGEIREKGGINFQKWAGIRDEAPRPPNPSNAAE